MFDFDSVRAIRSKMYGNDFLLTDGQAATIINLLNEKLFQLEEEEVQKLKEAAILSTDGKEE